MPESFASQERVSGFPEKGWTSGEVRETSVEVRGTSGEVWETAGNPWIAVKFHSERTSGEVTEKLPGKFGELPGKSGNFSEARGSLTPSQRLAKFVSNESRCKSNLREEKQHKHKLLGPDFPRTFLTLTSGCPGVKKFLHTTGAAARTSMTRRVVEKLCTKKCALIFWPLNLLIIVDQIIWALFCPPSM